MITQNVKDLRAAAIAGTLTEEQMIAAVKILREDRINAAKTTIAKKAKAKADIPNADDFLAELMHDENEEVSDSN